MKLKHLEGTCYLKLSVQPSTTDQQNYFLQISRQIDLKTQPVNSVSIAKVKLSFFIIGVISGYKFKRVPQTIKCCCRAIYRVITLKKTAIGPKKLDSSLYYRAPSTR